MARSINTQRRLLKPIIGLAVVAAGLLGAAGAAHADSNPTGAASVGACTGGTVNRPVTVTISERYPLTTGVQVLVVSGTPTGSVVATSAIKPLTFAQGQTEQLVTFTFDLPAGTYYFDWIDFSGGGSSGRHSQIPGDGFAMDNFLASKTTVAECVIATTTTVADTTTTAATTTTTVVVNPPTTAPTATTSASTTSTTIAVAPPSTSPTATTAVVQTTAVVSANTLPATGTNTAPMIGFGLGFLGIGSASVFAARRRRPAHER